MRTKKEVLCDIADLLLDMKLLMQRHLRGGRDLETGEDADAAIREFQETSGEICGHVPADLGWNVSCELDEGHDGYHAQARSGPHLVWPG